MAIVFSRSGFTALGGDWAPKVVAFSRVLRMSFGAVPRKPF